MHAILSIQKSSDPAENNTTLELVETQTIDKSPNSVLKYVIIFSIETLL